MKKIFLLPYWCKIVGLAVMAALVAMWIVSWVAGMGSIKSVDNVLWVEKIINDHTTTYIIALAIAMMAATFSRERDEDEYIATVRLKCLVAAFWIDLIFLIITALTVYSIEYAMIMGVQMFLILFLHVVIFNISMARIRRKKGHEE